MSAVAGVVRSRAARLLTRPRAPRPALARRWVAAGPCTIANGPAGGLAIEGVPLDSPQAYTLVRGILDTDVVEAFHRTLRPGAVAYDVGAHIGYFTLVLAAMVGPAGRVVTFEPDRRSAAVVRRNVARNGLGDRVAVREEAVAGRSGRAEFVAVDVADWSHLAERGGHPRARAVHEVDVVALDDLVARGEIPAPALVKLDIEGSEVQALEGMTAILREHRPALVVELHDTNAEVLALLAAAGYEAENLDGPEPVLEAGAVHVLARARS